LSASQIRAGGSVFDTATIASATSNAGGTVTYTVYTDSACSKGATSAGTKTVSNGAVPNSSTVSFPKSGTFYWQAVYSGDAFNAGSTSPCTSEVLTVTR